jgi:phosphoglucosamine mutase
MSNFGLERALRERGIDFRRAQVGDRYVLEMLKASGGTLGGETSGHLLCLDRTTTGDGLVSALQVLDVVKRSGRTLAELSRGMPRFPQKLVNVRVERRVDPRQSPPIQSAVAAAEQALGSRGRIVLRASGTEPVIRVMVEGEDGDEVARLADSLAAEVRAAAAA